MSDGRNAQGYFSQNEEEKYILEWTTEHGRLLDIGAWWPTNLSNSRALIERGWEAVLVEPSPGPMRVLLEEYGTNKRITLVQGACVALGPKSLEMQVTDYPVTTSDHQVYSVWSGDPKTRYLGVVHVQTIEASCLLRKFGPFDFVSIDAEGHSVSIASELLLCGIMPSCFCVEHDGHNVELQRLAESHGYTKFHLTAENLVAAR